MFTFESQKGSDKQELISKDPEQAPKSPPSLIDKIRVWVQGVVGHCAPLRCETPIINFECEIEATADVHGYDDRKVDFFVRLIERFGLLTFGTVVSMLREGKCTWEDIENVRVSYPRIAMSELTANY